MAAIPPSRYRKSLVAGCVALLAISLILFVVPSAPSNKSGNGAPTSPLLSLTPTASPSSGNGGPLLSPVPGEELGTPLLGDQAPAGTVVTSGGDNYVDTVVNATAVSINGHDAKRVLAASCQYCGSNSDVEAYVVLNLGRKYSTLRARLGATDRSKSTKPVTIEATVIDSGRQISIYNKSFTVGESEDVALPVSNVLQLKFVFRGLLNQVYAGVGDPTVFD
jgi:hypothetical protein